MTKLPPRKQAIHNADLPAYINAIEDDSQFVLAGFACTTGLRRDNTFALTWQDLKEDRLHVAHNKATKQPEVLMLSQYNVALLRSLPMIDNRIFYGVQWPTIINKDTGAKFTHHHARHAQRTTVTVHRQHLKELERACKCR